MGRRWIMIQTFWAMSIPAANDPVATDRFRHNIAARMSSNPDDAAVIKSRQTRSRAMK
jgi:hypothetical protein